MRIAIALVISFVTASLLMAALGSITYSGITAANDRRAYSFQTVTPKTNALQDMYADTTQLITAVDRYVLANAQPGTSGSGSVTDLKADILAQEQEVKVAFQAYSDAVDTNFSSEAPVRDIVSAKMANLFESTDKLVSVTDQFYSNNGQNIGDNSEVSAAHTQFVNSADDLLQNIDAPLTSARAENTEIRNSITTELSQLGTATTIFTVAAASLTGVSGYLIYKSFVLPLKNLKSAVERIAKGKFDTEISGIARKDEIGYLARAIRTMETDLEVRDNQKDEFISIASHELRTPIQPILGFAMLAKLGKISEERAWDSVLKEARRLQRLSNDILDVTKIGSNTLEYQIEKIKIHELLGFIVRSTSMDLKTGVTITLHFDETQKDVEIDADRSRMTQVFTNIIENAKKFTAEGEIKVATEVLTDKGVIKVRITDCGTGIPEEVLPVLFKKFATKNHGQAAGQGTGLGLYISRAIANAHGGDIAAYNNNVEVGSTAKGATFEITLPLKRVENAIAFTKKSNIEEIKEKMVVENTVSSNTNRTKG